MSNTNPDGTTDSTDFGSRTLTETLEPSPTAPTGTSIEMGNEPSFTVPPDEPTDAVTEPGVTSPSGAPDGGAGGGSSLTGRIGTYGFPGPGPVGVVVVVTGIVVLGPTVVGSEVVDGLVVESGTDV